MGERDAPTETTIAAAAAGRLSKLDEPAVRFRQKRSSRFLPARAASADTSPSPLQRKPLLSNRTLPSLQ